MRKGVRCGASMFLLGLIACSSSVSPSDGVSIASTKESVIASVSNGVVTLDVTLEITNGSKSAVLYQPCGAVLERNVDGAWRQVWAQTCFLSSQFDAATIAAGSSARFVVSIRAVQQAGDLNFPPGNVAGQYRIRLLLTSEAHESLPLGGRTSSPFSVE